MNILKEKIQTELIIKNSRFINELFVCDSQSLVRQMIKEQKEKYQDASHVCHAFVIGEKAEVLGIVTLEPEYTITHKTPSCNLNKSLVSSNAIAFRSAIDATLTFVMSETL